MIVIPAIDLMDSRCVRLLKGDFAQETRYSEDPVAIAMRFAESGFNDVHVVDLDGARSGSVAHAQIIEEIAAASGIAVQLGGGLRQESDLQSWFAAGVHRCVVGSIAAKEPETVTAWIKRFGADRIVLALDVRLNNCGVPMLATNGWVEQTDFSLWDCVAGYAAAGARHVLCTDIDRDGAMAGPNTELYRQFTERFPEIRLQASGGVRDFDDLLALRDTGAAAAITGKALHDERITEEELEKFRQSA